MTAHKHHKEMMQYAEDAAETDTPHERWEWRFHNDDRWHQLETDHVLWGNHLEYRRKPCTLTYTVTIPEPLRNELSNGERYFLAVPGELLERIMVVVAAAEKAEREACARLCDEVYRARRVHGAQDCAAAIRARGGV